MNMSYINRCSLMRPIPLYNSYLHPHVAQLPSQRSETAAQTRSHQVLYFRCFYIFADKFSSKKTCFCDFNCPSAGKEHNLWGTLQINSDYSRGICVNTWWKQGLKQILCGSNSSFPFADHSQCSLSESNNSIFDEASVWIFSL